MRGRVLTIAGSDCSGGAGLQADLKAIAALGGYGMSAVTALTVQNTMGVTAVLPVPPALVAAQIEACVADIGADAFKTGMLHDAELIETVAHALAPHTGKIPLVLDPVMVSKSGAALLQAEAVAALKEKLLPLSALVTPNIPEAEALLGEAITSVAAMKSALPRLATLGARAVLLKGGHMEGDVVTDMLWADGVLSTWASPRIHTRHTHGTGCTLASAIATLLAQGLGLKDACGAARAYVEGAIRHAPGFGRGHGPLNHGWSQM